MSRNDSVFYEHTKRNLEFEMEILEDLKIKFPKVDFERSDLSDSLSKLVYLEDDIIPNTIRYYTVPHGLSLKDCKNFSYHKMDGKEYVVPYIEVNGPRFIIFRITCDYYIRTIQDFVGNVFEKVSPEQIYAK